MQAIDHDRLTRWTPVLSVSDLPAGARRVVKTDCGKQIALFRLTDGALRACNNRCPHEGYPLVEGDLAEGGGAVGACRLTCNWHNWKFDLETGATLIGGDALRVYPAREREGEIELDLADPPPAAAQAKALDAMVAGFDRHEYDRIAREIARLQRAGGDPLEALRRAVRETADRLEFGATHALPASADWLRLAAAQAAEAPDRRLVAVLEGVGHFAWDSQRAPRYPFPEGAAAWDAGAFEAAVEAEDEAAALARVRGALDAGLGWAELEPAFARAALAHYADFGHAAIYTYKTRDLIGALNPDGETLAAILAMLTRSLVFATREDLIPEFKAYAPALAAWSGAGAAPSVEALSRSAVRPVMEAMAAGSGDPWALYDRAAEAAARQMLHFDLRLQDATDNPVSRNVGWLDVTHALTFANAVRKLAERTPEILPAGLLQIGCFLGRNSGFVDWSLDAEPWRVDDPAAFYRTTLDGLFDHGEAEYIVSAHLLKTTVALQEEFDERRDAPWAATAAAALNRFLSSPLKRKHALRVARQSQAFVALEG
ncbi:MAG: Rieske (2Fe-2S) protein [Marivibrio sp.]|uniref:Rieske (2Fe-2S) protein n=1 Tax=Marivibrio sp. TaxID=2039719 RepID=UPI0032EAD3F1